MDTWFPMAKRLNVSWDDLYKRLPIKYYSPPDFNAASFAEAQAKEWIKLFESNTFITLTNEERAEINEVFLDLTSKYCQFNTMVRNNLNIDHFVYLINAWSCKPSSGATERKFRHGNAVAFQKTDHGVIFHLQPGFMVAYIESRHCATAETDDGKLLQDITKDDFFTTIRNIFECEGLESLEVDLKNWSPKLPHYRELASFVEELRNRKNSTKIDKQEDLR